VETHIRTIVKALSWRCIATLITFTVAWIITGRLTFATEIGLADTLLKLGAYYLHERAWIHVNFGIPKKPEYEI
jgi:uncharacterized membrane protein